MNGNSDPKIGSNFFDKLISQGVKFDSGSSTGWYLLAFLAACPGIGQLGLNHYMVDQPAVAAAKAISLPLSYLLMIVLLPYLPLAIQGNWLFWVAGLGPWYIFDIIQAATGYEIGYYSMLDYEFIPLGGAEGRAGGMAGEWTLTLTKLNILFTAFAGSGQMLKYILPDSNPDIGNYISYLGAGLLTVSLAATLFARKDVAPAGYGLLSGGSQGQLPSLSTILDGLPAQNGGGDMSPLFLQGLGFIALTGITLGLIRSKQ
uniref:Uncharacterized protein n=1 Tax=viral metagenome TaxID=1070528 RepID=A0A6C0K7D8_9ZZZZ